ncbi:hypothetical protein T552_03020 [Pneumocystis carinii B80]|uniref:Pentacotripeptide-repeat region of PRORP domain-containing protein n=1 Tax=Pneumocystis carinii (strain B80) TaxID=1408658 RepID=A0A0W4ZCW0_PNEC8|nr:hypothetical protein T552_03020 [Pneumocystis carinii B80]KTW26126.1 hypothetical protein T552_03020 [Pneumocystis carinii B80]
MNFGGVRGIKSRWLKVFKEGLNGGEKGTRTIFFGSFIDIYFFFPDKRCKFHVLTRTRKIKSNGVELRGLSVLCGGPETLSITPFVGEESRISILKSKSDITLEYEEKMSKLLEENRYFNVIEVYNEMKSLGITLSVKLYDIIIQSMVKIRQPGVATMIHTLLDTYKSMLEQQLTPNVSIYSTLILALCVREEEVYSQLQTLNNKISRGLPNSLQLQERLNSLKKENNLSMACEIFKASVSVRFQPYSSDVFSELMRICALVGKTDELLMIYRKIVNHNVIPSPHVFISLIRGFSMHKDVKSMVECFNEYKKFASKMEPHDKYDVYCALIDGYFRSSRSYAAISFFEKMAAQKNAYIPYKVFKIIIFGLSLNGDYLTAKSWIDRMIKDENLPDPTPSCTIPVISGAIKANDLEVAISLFDYASSIGSIKPFGRVVFDFIHLCLKHGKNDYVNNVLNRVSVEGIRPDEMSTQAIALEMIKNDDIESCLQLYKLCLKLNVQHFGSTRYIRRGFTLAGISIMEELKRKNILNFKLCLEIIADVCDTAFYIPYPMLLYVLKYYFMEKKMSVETWRANFKSWDPFVLSLSLRVLCFSIKQERGSYAHRVFPELVSDIISEDLTVIPGSAMAVSDTLRILGEKVLSAEWEKYIQKYKSHDTCTVDKRVLQVSNCQRLRPLSIDLMRDWNQVRNHPHIDFSTSQKVLNDSICHNKTNDYSALVHEIYVTYNRGKDITPEAYCRLMERLGKEKRLDLVNDLYKFARKSISKNFTGDTGLCYHGYCLNSMIISQIYSNQMDEAKKYQRELLELGFSPNASVFATYIINLKNPDPRQDADDAMNIYYEAKSYNVELTAYFYNALLSKLSKADKLHESLELFSEMKKNNTIPNSITYGTLINTCCRVGNEELANDLFIEMENVPRYYARVAPYNIMMQFYLHNKKNRQMVLKYYDRLCNQVLAPSSHTYKLLIDCWTILDPPDINKALEIIADMTKNSVPITTLHHGAIIYAKGCILKDLKSARRYFDSITRRYFKPVIPDHILYEALIDAYVTNCSMKNIPKLLFQMKNNNIILNSNIANILIRGWMQEGQIEKAREVFDSLNLETDSFAKKEPKNYIAMIQAYLSVKDIASAKAIFEEMKTYSSSQIDISHAEALFKK